MNNDLQLFTKVINHLVFLTTRDEYGSLRTRNIDSLEPLHIELNDEQIVPPRGFWTENSLKLFFSRIKKKYDSRDLIDLCDIDLIGRNAWEYQSCTRYEEIIDTSCKLTRNTPVTYVETYPLFTYEPIEGENWKAHEVGALKIEHKKMHKLIK